MSIPPSAGVSSVTAAVSKGVLFLGYSRKGRMEETGSSTSSGRIGVTVIRPATGLSRGTSVAAPVDRIGNCIRLIHLTDLLFRSCLAPLLPQSANAHHGLGELHKRTPTTEQAPERLPETQHQRPTEAA